MSILLLLMLSLLLLLLSTVSLMVFDLVVGVFFYVVLCIDINWVANFGTIMVCWGLGWGIAMFHINSIHVGLIMDRSWSYA
jgi:hypothetical protein